MKVSQAINNETIYYYYLLLTVRDMFVVFTLICQPINTLTYSAVIASSPFRAQAHCKGHFQAV